MKTLQRANAGRSAQAEFASRSHPGLSFERGLLVHLEFEGSTIHYGSKAQSDQRQIQTNKTNSI